MPTDFFGPDVAATYDADDDPRFYGDALAAEVDFLADLAGDRGVRWNSRSGPGGSPCRCASAGSTCTASTSRRRW